LGVLLAGGAAASPALHDAPVLPAGTRFTGRAVVIDGDTLAMATVRLRIQGIDAPELSQRCERGGRLYACGERARQAMSRILGRGVAACVQLATDRYRRRVVRCHNAAGKDIGGELVRQGWAIAPRGYSTAYVAAEAEARAARRGLWAGRFLAPADWRARTR
jgi:endonuclease YncB( thermonuclease family)